MTKKASTPALRFKGFTYTWEQRKLSDMCSLITKGTTPLDKSNSGTVNFIKIESIDESSGEIKITQKITAEEHNGYLRRSQLKENDILFSSNNPVSGLSLSCFLRIFSVSSNPCIVSVSFPRSIFFLLGLYDLLPLFSLSARICSIDFRAFLPERSPITSGILKRINSIIATTRQIPAATKDIFDIIDSVSAITSSPFPH